VSARRTGGAPWLRGLSSGALRDQRLPATQLAIAWPRTPLSPAWGFSPPPSPRTANSVHFEITAQVLKVR